MRGTTRLWHARRHYRVTVTTQALLCVVPRVCLICAKAFNLFAQTGLDWPTVSGFACAHGSNGPVERTGGETRRQVYQALHGEAPLAPANRPVPPVMVLILISTTRKTSGGSANSACPTTAAKMLSPLAAMK